MLILVIIFCFLRVKLLGFPLWAKAVYHALAYCTNRIHGICTLPALRVLGVSLSVGAILGPWYQSPLISGLLTQKHHKSRLVALSVVIISSTVTAFDQRQGIHARHSHGPLYVPSIA